MSRYDQPDSDDRDHAALSDESRRRTVPCRHCGTPVDVEECPPPIGWVCDRCWDAAMATQMCKAERGV